MVIFSIFSFFHLFDSVNLNRLEIASTFMYAAVYVCTLFILNFYKLVKISTAVKACLIFFSFQYSIEMNRNQCGDWVFITQACLLHKIYHEAIANCLIVFYNWLLHVLYDKQLRQLMYPEKLPRNSLQNLHFMNSIWIVLFLICLNLL